MIKTIIIPFFVVEGQENNPNHLVQKYAVIEDENIIEHFNNVFGSPNTAVEYCLNQHKKMSASSTVV